MRITPKQIADLIAMHEQGDLSWDAVKKIARHVWEKNRAAGFVWLQGTDNIMVKEGAVSLPPLPPISTPYCFVSSPKQV